MLNLISDFRYSLYPPVYHPAECRLVHRLVFVPLPVLLDDVCAENVRKVKPPALQWDCASEIGVVIDLFRYPVFFLSAQWFSVAHFLTEHIDLAALQGFQCGDFSRHELCCYLCCCHIVFDFYLCGFESFGCLFHLFSVSRYPTFFLCVFRSLRYVSVSGALKGRD